MSDMQGERGYEKVDLNFLQGLMKKNKDLYDKFRNLDFYVENSYDLLQVYNREMNILIFVFQEFYFFVNKVKVYRRGQGWRVGESSQEVDNGNFQ